MTGQSCSIQTRPDSSTAPRLLIDTSSQRTQLQCCTAAVFLCVLDIYGAGTAGSWWVFSPLQPTHSFSRPKEVSSWRSLTSTGEGKSEKAEVVPDPKIPTNWSCTDYSDSYSNYSDKIIYLFIYYFILFNLCHWKCNFTLAKQTKYILLTGL